MIARQPPTRSGNPTRSRRSFEHSPMLVFYEVTQACDLICQHCRACAQSHRHPFELGTDESKRMISQLAEFPVPPMLVLTGGDPLKRSDIFELIEHAVACGLQVSITPSATPLVSQAAIQRLRDAGIARMAISIDGADAATHDTNRGVAGSFDRSLQILHEARSLSVQTQINTTLTPRNVDQIETMADRFADLGIALWSVFFLVPVGRAGAMERLDGEACERAFERLWVQSRCQPYLIKTTEAPHYRRYSLQQQGPKVLGENASSHRPFLAAGVNDGKGVMFVSHTGTIHPSGFLPIICGMYPQQHVVSVYQNSPLFRRLRDANQLQGKCGDCEFRHVCGGSRARAYAVTGNLMAQEPDCLYVPERMSRETCSPS